MEVVDTGKGVEIFLYGYEALKKNCRYVPSSELLIQIN